MSTGRRPHRVKEHHFALMASLLSRGLSRGDVFKKFKERHPDISDRTIYGAMQRAFPHGSYETPEDIERLLKQQLDFLQNTGQRRLEQLERINEKLTPEQRSEMARRGWVELSESEKRKRLESGIHSITIKQRNYRKTLSERLGKPIRFVLEEALKSENPTAYLSNLGIKPIDLWRAGYDTEIVLTFFPIDFLIGRRDGESLK